MVERQVEIFDIAHRHRCQRKLIDDIRMSSFRSINQHRQTSNLYRNDCSHIKTIA